MPQVGANRFIRTALTTVVMILLTQTIAPRVGKSLEQDAKNGRLIPVQIAGNEFQIPQFYFLPQDVPSRPQRRDFLIHALWPDMAPMREDNKQKYARVTGHGDLLTILVLDQNQTTTLQFRLDARKKLGGPYARAEDAFGLQVYLPKDLHATDIKLWRQAIYINETAAGLASVISCTLDGSFPDPGCDAEFDYKGMLLDVEYGKHFLPQWRSIEQVVKALFDSFEVHARLLDQTPPARGLKEIEYGRQFKAEAVANASRTFGSRYIYRYDAMLASYGVQYSNPALSWYCCAVIMTLWSGARPQN